MNCCVDKVVPVHNSLYKNKDGCFGVTSPSLISLMVSVDVEHHVYVTFGVALIVSVRYC